MPARRRSKRCRKRKLSFDHDTTIQPRPKKRKLSSHNKRTKNNTKTQPKPDDKSHSTSPTKISKHATNPFKNINIPTVKIFNQSNKPKPTRRHSQYTRIQNKDEVEDEEDDDDSTSPESTSPYYKMHRIPLKHSTIRSQQSTPIRGITTDNKPPQSQSAKRSKIRYITHTPLRMQTLLQTTRDSSLTPPPPITANDRKSVPALFSSQDSLALSPYKSPTKRNINPCLRTPQRRTCMHVIPVNATPVRPTITAVSSVNHNNGIVAVSNVNVTSAINGELEGIQKDTEPPNERDSDSKSVGGKFGILYILLFALIGFMAGFIVAASVYHEKELRRNAKGNVFDAIKTCSCSVARNSSSSECRPCLDAYWTLKSHCDERDRLKAEKQTLERNKQWEMCDLRLTEIESENAKCGAEKVRLNAELRRLNGILYGNTNSCHEYKLKVDALGHDLGECNVEWGSCEQLGRQKDKLDEKRLEEIEKQKKKFSMCNDQLKRYKEKAKKQRG